MQTTKLSGRPLTIALNWLKSAFPRYKGRKVYFEISDKYPSSLNSYWDSGHRDYYAGVQLSTGRVQHIEQNGTPFDGKDFKYQPTPGIAVLQHTYSGSNQYCKIWLHPADVPQAKRLMLIDASPEEVIALP